MKLVQLRQGSPEWLTWRLQGIGGSDAASIIGIAPFKDATRESVMREKVDLWQKESTYAMRRGNRLEGTARTLYELRLRCNAPAVCVEHDAAPWIRVSLDGLCSAREGMPVVAEYAAFARWILELKCPKWQVHDCALEGVVPHFYMPQCQWQLLATGLDRLDFVSYNDGARFREADRLAIVPVEPDAEMQAMLLEECERFWAEVLIARDAKTKAVPVRAPALASAFGGGVTASGPELDAW